MNGGWGFWGDMVFYMRTLYTILECELDVKLLGVEATYGHTRNAAGASENNSAYYKGKKGHFIGSRTIAILGIITALWEMAIDTTILHGRNWIAAKTNGAILSQTLIMLEVIRHLNYHGGVSRSGIPIAMLDAI